MSRFGRDDVLVYFTFTIVVIRKSLSITNGTLADFTPKLALFNTICLSTAVLAAEFSRFGRCFRQPRPLANLPAAQTKIWRVVLVSTREFWL